MFKAAFSAKASPRGNADSRYPGTYTDRGSPQEAGAAVSFSVREVDGLSGGSKGAKPPGSSYKDSLANPATLEKSACGGYAIVAECSSGQHHFGKKLVCGREWCEVCGQDNSAAHKRRQARLLPKFQQVNRLGYLVVEWPDWARHIGERGFNPDLDGGEYIAGWCYSKADLRDTTNTIVDVLAGKRCGRRGRVGGYFSRGVGRWHWFNDKPPLDKYNPHFNGLVDFESLSDEVRWAVQPDIDAYKVKLKSGKQTKKVRKKLRGTELYERRESGYMPEPLLDKIRADLRTVLNVPDLIVEYRFADKPGQIVHKVRYVTRATFHNQAWDKYMAHELYNFRNIRWWGGWKGEPVWTLAEAEAQGEDVSGLEAVSKLQEGVCPDCGLPLKVLYHNHKTGKPVQWSRPVDSVYLGIWQAEEIAGSGYYRIPHREWDGYSFSPGELLRLERLEAEHLAKVERRAKGKELSAGDYLKWLAIGSIQRGGNKCKQT